jgi:hypothetical protein
MYKLQASGFAGGLLTSRSPDSSTFNPNVKEDYFLETICLDFPR